jgi:hypothetical protein
MCSCYPLPTINQLWYVNDMQKNNIIKYLLGAIILIAIGYGGVQYATFLGVFSENENMDDAPIVDNIPIELPPPPENYAELNENAEVVATMRDEFYKLKKEEFKTILTTIEEHPDSFLAWMRL